MMGQMQATETELNAALVSLLAPANALLSSPALSFTAPEPNPVSVAEKAVTLVAKRLVPMQRGLPQWDRLDELAKAVALSTSARRYKPDDMKSADQALAALLRK